MYALYHLAQREVQKAASARNGTSRRSSEDSDEPTVPQIFLDPGYSLVGTSVLSTSNCGNPALRLFGFGPVTPEGFGIGEYNSDEG